MSDDFDDTDDLDDTAEKLYGGDTPSTATPAPAGSTDVDAATAVYGYSALESAIDQRGDELRSVTGATEAMQRQTREQSVKIASDGLPGSARNGGKDR